MIQLKLKKAVIEKAFAGKKDFFNHMVATDGAPSRTADFMGQMCYDYTNKNVYINTTSATTWTLVNY
jgi:hypothetical protein